MTSEEIREADQYLKKVFDKAKKVIDSDWSEEDVFKAGEIMAKIIHARVALQDASQPKPTTAPSSTGKRLTT